MQIINSKNKSIKMRVGIASAALCASFLLGANNSQTAKADTIDSSGQEPNSALGKENSSAENVSQVHPDIPVQVVNGTNNTSEQNKQLADTNNVQHANIPVTVVGSNSETSKPTITKTNNDAEISSSKKNDLQEKSIRLNTGDLAWQDMESSYNSNSHTLTLKNSDSDKQFISPNPIYQQFANIANDIQTIRITNDNTIHFTGSAKGFFSNLPSLTKIEGLENVDVYSVTDMSYLFDSDTSLTKVDISTWYPQNTTDMSHMFSNCPNLARVYVGDTYSSQGNWFDTRKVTSMQGMFQHDKSLNYIGVPNDNLTNPADYSIEINFASDSMQDVSYMFQDCDSLVTVNFNIHPQDYTLKVSPYTLSHLFADCANLKQFEMTGSNSYQINDLSYALANDPKLERADLAGIYEIQEDGNMINASHMFYNDPLLSECLFGPMQYLTDTSYMFAGDKLLDYSLLSIMSNFSSEFNPNNDDSGQIAFTTNMSHMLDGCSGVTELDLSRFSTNDNLQADKTDMFKGLTSLKKVTLGKDVNLNGTGFMPPFEYTAVGTGSEDKPNGKTYTATGLRKFWNKQTGTETFIGTPATYYQVTINYLDAKTKKVLKSTTKEGNSKDPIEFAQEYQDTLNELTKDGNYTYDSKNSNVPLDKNNDIQLPDTVNSDVTYNVMLVPKETPTIPAKPPVVPDNPSDNHDQDTDHQQVPGKSENAPGSTIITNVIVHYQDEFGNKLQADKTITGKLGGSWNAVPAKIKGYHFVNTKGMATGTISDVRQEVTFVYAKDQAAKPNKPAKPSRPDEKPSQKPHKKQNIHKKQHVIDHGAVNKPVKKTKSNKVASFTRPTIVKVAHATSVGKSIRNNSSYDSKLPQTGTDNQTNTLVATIGAGALLTSMISAFGISKKKKIN